MTNSPKAHELHGLEYAWKAQVPGAPKVDATMSDEDLNSFVERVCELGNAPQVFGHTWVQVAVAESQTEMKLYNLDDHRMKLVLSMSGHLFPDQPSALATIANDNFVFLFDFLFPNNVRRTRSLVPKTVFAQEAAKSSST
jgi:hypothetical protein